jgi:DNA replication protein DnaC
MSTSSTRALRDRLIARAALILDAEHSDYLAATGKHDYPDRELAWEDIRLNREIQTEQVISRWLDQVPPLYEDTDLARLRPEQQGDQIRDYFDSGARNLLLLGPVGTGKSYAAWALAHEAVSRGLSTNVWSVPRLLLDMRPSGDTRAFVRACSSRFLVLDDLAAARMTDWATEQMYAIADHRASHQFRTVITANASWDDLVAMWGLPTMDRFRDGALDLVLRGDSLRRAHQ